MPPLAAIRLAMLGGVLLFGLATWALQATGGWEPARSVDRVALGGALKVLWIGAAIGVALLAAKRRQGAPQSPRSAMLAVLAWALGETVALFGGVIYFLTGEPASYLAGLAFLGVTMLFFPTSGR
jgi:F0F1-type ATP synthase membrane subunit c/vacuolar-type H+-ATPase subunit K